MNKAEFLGHLVSSASLCGGQMLREALQARDPIRIEPMLQA